MALRGAPDRVRCLWISFGDVATEILNHIALVVFNRIDPDTEPGVADIADNLKNEMIMYGSIV